MDIFIRNIPVSATGDQLTEFLRPVLHQIAVVSFHCHKIRAKGCAILTIADRAKALLFLEMYGLPSNPPPRSRPKNALFFVRKPMNITPSTSTPSEVLLRTLELEAKKIIKKQKQTAAISHSKKKGRPYKFQFHSMSCGSWTYEKSALNFNPYFKDLRAGSIVFGKSSLVILLDLCQQIPWACRLDIHYSSIKHILIGGTNNPTVSITLSSPPKIYKIDTASNISGLDSLAQAMNSLSIYLPQPRQQITRTRLSGIDSNHAAVVSFCWVYRVCLSDRASATAVYELLTGSSAMPETTYFRTLMKDPHKPFVSDYRLLKNRLSDYTQLQSLDFGLRFQIARLVQNAILPPAKVLSLLPEIERLVKVHGLLKVTVAVQKLASQVPWPGPDVEAQDFEIKELVRLINESAARFFRVGSMYDLVQRHKHLALIHKVTVTPCGLFLGGPAPEVTNRVLRKYSAYTDYFIRVTFADEDGELIHFDGRASQQKIFHERFKSVLEHGIDIAGRSFEFLGFSHSSLRSQTCWFMAPVPLREGGLLYPTQVIQQLGDFTTIRSPAKCAARIGQAFSDTAGAVTIDPKALDIKADVERNGRTFSDGCGTISQSLLKKVWQGYAIGRNLKPTVLQIRIAGAKGVISLDTTLTGNKLFLRPSMTKFDATGSCDIEICGAAMKPLPLYLNRQFIKILEDLGVEPDVFLDLQAAMVEKLRMITLTPPNAATFLEWCRVGNATKTPALIRLLNDIGLPFQQDDFLRDTVEIAALSQLREIKHRSRILVENGLTLFGIMDETNTLNEGEIYAVSEKVDSNGQWQRVVLTGGQVAITRSPALHPGDIQIVQAVDVPPDSPLAKLCNCVVFSQKGDRDLPSQLSGGDLDGDLYNIIFEPLLMPKMTHCPADYPRQAPVDIGRPVEKRDITNFFIQFMETDQLGRISMMHQQMADRQDQGTLDPICISLAGMASTAVDFSKTGIPVDMKDFPKQDYIRPDFMATGPRVIVEKKGAMFEDDEEDDEHDPVSAMEPDHKTHRYYESNKVLGQLYRAIDEKAFFEQMQKDSKTLASRDPSHRPLMERLWDYVKRETVLVQWEEYIDLAKNIRESYESNLIETMEQYSIHHAHPLKELEVFSGSILGKSIGAQNRRIREMTTDMKESFERDVAFTVDYITQGEDSNKDEALARSIACLANAMLEPVRWKKTNLQSWKYVAAAVCLKELERFQGGILRRI